MQDGVAGITALKRLKTVVEDKLPVFTKAFPEASRVIVSVLPPLIL
jgi:hypothetical protein